MYNCQVCDYGTNVGKDLQTHAQDAHGVRILQQDIGKFAGFHPDETTKSGLHRERDFGSISIILPDNQP